MCWQDDGDMGEEVEEDASLYDCKCQRTKERLLPRGNSQPLALNRKLGRRTFAGKLHGAPLHREQGVATSPSLINAEFIAMRTTAADYCRFIHEPLNWTGWIELSPIPEPCSLSRAAAREPSKRRVTARGCFVAERRRSRRQLLERGRAVGVQEIVEPDGVLPGVVVLGRDRQRRHLRCVPTVQVAHYVPHSRTSRRRRVGTPKGYLDGDLGFLPVVLASQPLVHCVEPPASGPPRPHPVHQHQLIERCFGVDGAPPADHLQHQRAEGEHIGAGAGFSGAGEFRGEVPDGAHHAGGARVGAVLVQLG